MKKINFQNAEIISPAKVTIEGIDYEVTPAQLTLIEKYLSAETLNELQSNIEEIGVVVSPTQPTTNEKVWIKTGKNLSKKSGFSAVNADGGTNIVKVKVEPNTDYTISAIKSRISGVNITNTGFHGVGGVKAYDVLGNEVANLYRSNAYYLESGSTRIEFPITTPSNCNYIIVDFNNNNGDFNFNISVSQIQIEQGSATEYEAYVEKAIYVKNDNGVYEEFVNIENINQSIERKILTSSISITELANESLVNSSEVTVEKTGYYAVNLFLNMCGASSITNVGAYYTVRILVNNSSAELHNLGNNRHIVVPIAKVWNYTNTATVFVPLKKGDKVCAEFTNNTGVSTNNQYASTFGFKLVKVSE